MNNLFHNSEKHNRKIPFEQIRAAALSQAKSLVFSWFPNGKILGHEFHVGSLYGEKGSSLRINLTTGKWSDFASGEAGGDIISLFAAKNKLSQADSALKLQDILGVGTDTVDQFPPRQFTDVSSDWQPGIPPDHAPIPDLSSYNHVYAYRDSNGKILRYILRHDARGEKPKSIIPLTWGKKRDPKSGVFVEGWHYKAAATPRSLYGMEKLSASKNVLICEGEKATDAAQKLFPSIACLSWSGGANAVSYSDWSALKGCKVVLWPDNDQAGIKASKDILQVISGIADSVKIINTDGLPDGFDAADLTTDNPKSWLMGRLGDVVGGTSVAKAKATTYVEPDVRRAAKLDPIQVREGEIDLIATAGEEALTKSEFPVFQRGGKLVRPGFSEVFSSSGNVIRSAGLNEITPAGLTDLLCQVVEWQKWDGRKESYRQINPPPFVATTILSRNGLWNFPSISSVITTPTLRPDGSVLCDPGYDRITRLYYIEDENLTIHLPEPSLDAARQAVRTLEGLLVNFPFTGDVDKSVVLAGMLTSVCRGAMSVSPLFAFRASSAGSGKSFLVDLISAIATGRACPVVSAGYDSEETEKRLVGLLLGSYPLLSLDNVNGELGGDLLCQAVERPLIRLRELGKSTISEIENRSVIFATGNNLTVKGDMTRRTMLATLDAEMERPELRKFSFDPMAEVMNNRGKFVSACLTIVRSWMNSGDRVSVSPLASYEEWSKTVRSALVWLGYEDPAKSIETARGDDPELADLRELLGLWGHHIGFNIPVTIRALDEKTKQCHLASFKLMWPDFRDVLLRLAGNATGNINARTLGKFFLTRRGKIVNGMKLEKSVVNDRTGVAKWMVVQIK